MRNEHGIDGIVFNATRGRPRGSLNKKSRSILDEALTNGITPLEVMVNIMRKAYESGDFVVALDAAKSAAPYMHAKINHIDIGGVKNNPVRVVVAWEPTDSGSAA